MVEVRARYPWALLPAKAQSNISAARHDAALYSKQFRWLRRDRVPELCWPWRLGHEVGWTIPSPVHVRMDRIEDLELSAADPEELQAAATAAGYDALWRRGPVHIATRSAGWIRESEVKTDRGWEAMFVPNGGGTLEWHLGWNVEIPAGYFLLVVGTEELPQLEVPAGMLDSKALSRLNQTTGMAIAIRPRGPVEISRGQAVARMLLLHPESLKAQLHVAGTEGVQ